MADEERFNSIRDRGVLGTLIGARIVDITEDDLDERAPDALDARVYLHFDNGETLAFWVSDDKPMTVSGMPDDEAPKENP